MGYLLNVIYGFGLLLSLPWLIYRAIRTKRYRAGWREKFFGLVPANEESNRVIWLHAVSVGEVQLLRILVLGIENRFPEYKLFISTTTRSGMELAEKAFAKHNVFYFPLDFTWAVQNAIRRIKPTLLVLVELEVWPNLVRAAKRNNCPIAIVNGRLSKRSFDGYFRLRSILSSTFSALDSVMVQDEVYAQRFEAMGVPKKHIVIAGNLKFDGAISDRSHPEVVARRNQLALDSAQCVWVVGSTQAPEEQYAVDVFRNLRLQFPQCRMILVPRQPDRFDEVARLLESAGVKIVRRSQMANSVIQDWDVLLGDTIGELRWWWGLADFAFVGGSFGDRGGQNMIEPAAFGVPTAVGPNTKNFADTVRILLEADALKQLQDPSELYDWACQNMKSAASRQEMGSRARDAVIQHRGALDRTLATLEKFL